MKPLLDRDGSDGTPRAVRLASPRNVAIVFLVAILLAVVVFRAGGGSSSASGPSQTTGYTSSASSYAYGRIFIESVLDQGQYIPTIEPHSYFVVTSITVPSDASSSSGVFTAGISLGSPAAGTSDVTFNQPSGIAILTANEYSQLRSQGVTIPWGECMGTPPTCENVFPTPNGESGGGASVFGSLPATGRLYLVLVNFGNLPDSVVVQSGIEIGYYVPNCPTFPNC